MNTPIPTEGDIVSIGLIAERFRRWRRENSLDDTPEDQGRIVNMLLAVHNGNPGLLFDWKAMLALGDAAFLADMSGIIRHVNNPGEREPVGFLRRGFAPQCAERVPL